MIRCIRLWAAADGASHVEEGSIALSAGSFADQVSETIDVATSTFRSTPVGETVEWHTAPARQLVITLSGTLDFETRAGDRFTLRPGDVLFAEDTTGSGHAWQLAGNDPWHRLYVVLAEHATVPFIPG